MKILRPDLDLFFGKAYHKGKQPPERIGRYRKKTQEGRSKMGLERFQRFTSTDKSFVPMISIWNKGQIWIGSGAVNKFDLDRFTHVVFLYDETAREIGLLFRGNDKEEGTIKLGKRQTGIVVGAKNFLDCFNIDYSQTKQYLMRVEQAPDLFVISLDQGKISTKSKGGPEEDAPEP